MRPSTLNRVSAVDQRNGSGVGVGVGVGVEVPAAVATGEGDCAAVPTGVGEGMNSRRTILSFAGVGAVVFMCDPAFVVVFAPVGAVTVGLLFGEPIGATMIPAAWFRVPICAPEFIPRCVPVFVFAPTFGTLGAVVPVRGTTVEPLCPATMPVDAAV